IPKPQHLASQSKINHQGRDETRVLNSAEQKMVLDILKKDSENSYQNYLKMINQTENGDAIDASKDGLARELARMNLPLNCYTQWYWKIDLHNLLHFLYLRADSHAQYEIRVYAEIMLDIVKKWVPASYNAFIKNQKTGKNISGPALNVIKKLLNVQKITQQESGLSAREWGELENLLEVKL
ncbi:MAG: FAD-dependent thymidylate synthase, partial [Alphaproteobacteria bacterium]